MNITSSPRGNPRSTADIPRQFELAGLFSLLTCWTSDFKEGIMQSSNLYTIMELSTWVLRCSFSLPCKERPGHAESLASWRQARLCHFSAVSTWPICSRLCKSCQYGLSKPTDSGAQHKRALGGKQIRIAGLLKAKVQGVICRPPHEFGS